MCYTILRPTPSKNEFSVGELRLVQRFGAPITPCIIDPLVCVLARESHLVVHLSPMRRASQGRVSVFDVKSTQEAYVPICKLFYNV